MNDPTPISSTMRRILTALSALMALTSFSSAQEWGALPGFPRVPIRESCSRTRHGIAVSIQPSLLYPHGLIYWCSERAHILDARHPGCSRFFLVHEYGHLVLGTRDEGEADEWAARQLASVQNGQAVLRAVLFHLTEEGEPNNLYYGSTLDRARRIALAANLTRDQWPAGLTAYDRRRREIEADEIRVSITVLPGLANRVDGILYLDGRPIGFATNRRTELRLPSLLPGVHSLRLDDAWVSQVKPGARHTVIDRNLSAELKFTWRGGKVINILAIPERGNLAIRVQ